MRVLLADDHRLMLDGIRRALEADGGFEIVGETQDGGEVLGLVTRTRPDLVLLDVRMPHVDGISCLEQIRRRHPGVEVVMLSASTSPDVRAAARRHGALAYLSKTIDPDGLPATLREALAAGAWSDDLSGPDRAADDDATGLTARESTILEALSRGLSNAEIAKELWVTEQTVKFHLTNVYRKLGARSRTDAIRRAYERGLVESPMYGEE